MIEYFKIIRIFLGKYESKLVNIFFWLLIISFFADRVINHFFHLPLFVISALVIFPFLFITTQYNNPDKRILNVLVFSFVAIGSLNSVFYLFDVKNISDLLFILLLFTSYFYYRNHMKFLNIKNIYLLFFFSITLFFFTFFSINTSPIKPTTYHAAVNREKLDDNKPFSTPVSKPEKQVDKRTKSVPDSKPKKQVQNKPPKKIEMNEARGSIKWKSNPQDRAEEKRNYHNGLFRVPHIASYFFGLLFLFFAYQYQKTKRILNIVLLIISLFLCLYTGSRAILLAFVLSVFLFLMQRKHLVYLLIMVIAMFLLVMTNDFFIVLTKNTFLNQYFVFIETSTENFTRLSRFRIWYSWWMAMQEFDFWNFIIGKSYINSYVVNDKNLGYYIWFHNDFLSILYSYGIFGFVLYIAFFIKIYHDNKSLIKQNIFIFVFYFSMIFTAILNGYYYYFPVFLLYIFFLMIKNEKQLATS